MTAAATFNRTFAVGDRRVGSGEPTLIIAEAGVSHFGDAGKARELVDLAAEAGADVFKTQAFSTDALVAKTLPEWRDRLRPKEVGFDFVAAMKRRCDERGIAFMCTAHDDTVLPWLDELDVAAFKIGSGERGNTAYFRKIASRGKPVILSTGMYRRTDVEEAVAVFAETGCRDLGLLHCVTSYPTPPDQINLRAMEVLREVFPGVVGYSDHTCGHQVPLAAVALGAAIVEKHITLDFDVPNAQDWKVSAGPDDFADFVKAVRDVQRALGNAAKEPQPCEQGALEWALKSLVASRALAAGTVLAEADLVAKRPGGGVPPSRLAEVAGRTLARAVEPDQALSWDDLT